MARNSLCDNISIIVYRGESFQYKHITHQQSKIDIDEASRDLQNQRCLKLADVDVRLRCSTESSHGIEGRECRLAVAGKASIRSQIKT